MTFSKINCDFVIFIYWRPTTHVKKLAIQLWVTTHRLRNTVIHFVQLLRINIQYNLKSFYIITNKIKYFQVKKHQVKHKSTRCTHIITVLVQSERPIFIWPQINQSFPMGRHRGYKTLDDKADKCISKITIQLYHFEVGAIRT